MDNLVRKVEYSFDLEKIKKEVLDLLSVYNWKQIGLTHSDRDLSEEEKLTDSTHSAFDSVTKKFIYKEKPVYSIFNDRFKNTYLHEVWKTLPNVTRFRILVMDGPSCYTIHTDGMARYHLAVETDPKCLFLFPDHERVFHIPADGNVYLAETREKHTFVNGSRSRRIHLVLDDITSMKT